MAFDVDSFLRTTDQGTATPPAPSLVRENRAKSDEELSIGRGPEYRATGARPGIEFDAERGGGETAEERQARRDVNNPVKDDWIAQQVIAGLPAMGAGKVAAAGAEALGAAPLAVRTAGAAAEGATVAKETGGNAGEGAALGAAIPLAGRVLRKGAEVASTGLRGLVGGAKERAIGRAQSVLTEDVRAGLKERITEPAALTRITKVLASPEVRAVASDPPKLMELAAKRGGELGEASQRGFAMLDKANPRGGMEVVDVTAPLLKLRKSFVDTSRDPAMAHAVDGLIDQFRGGLGRDPAAAIPSATVRKWLTEEIQGPGFGPGDPRFDPPPRRAALQEASGVIKDALANYARKHGGDTAAQAMQNINDQITAYKLMLRSATERTAKIHQAPGAFQRVTDALHGHKGEGLGALAGYHVAGLPGALLGGAAGRVAAQAPGALDEWLAQSPMAQRFAAAGVPTITETPTLPLVQGAVGADKERRR